MIDLFKGDKTTINIDDLYLKRLFDNKYFLYFVALKQNYWENILTELDTILSNKYIKDHPIVKIILKNEIYINLIPELLDKQLKIIETSKLDPNKPEDREAIKTRLAEEFGLLY